MSAGPDFMSSFLRSSFLESPFFMSGACTGTGTYTYCTTGVGLGVGEGVGIGTCRKHQGISWQAHHFMADRPPHALNPERCVCLVGLHSRLLCGFNATLNRCYRSNLLARRRGSVGCMMHSPGIFFSAPTIPPSCTASWMWQDWGTPSRWQKADVVTGTCGADLDGVAGRGSRDLLLRVSLLHVRVPGAALAVGG